MGDVAMAINAVLARLSRPGQAPLPSVNQLLHELASGRDAVGIDPNANDNLTDLHRVILAGNGVTEDVMVEDDVKLFFVEIINMLADYGATRSINHLATDHLMTDATADAQSYRYGYTPLALALQQGMYVVAHRLLELGADPNVVMGDMPYQMFVRDERGGEFSTNLRGIESPLRIVLRDRQIDLESKNRMLQALLDRGADPLFGSTVVRKWPINAESYLATAYRINYQPSTVNLLVERGCTFWPCDKRPYRESVMLENQIREEFGRGAHSFLQTCMTNFQIPIVPLIRRLYPDGANINVPIGTVRPLAMALHLNCLSGFEEMLRLGADINQTIRFEYNGLPDDRDPEPTPSVPMLTFIALHPDRSLRRQLLHAAFGYHEQMDVNIRVNENNYTTFSYMARFTQVNAAMDAKTESDLRINSRDFKFFLDRCAALPPERGLDRNRADTTGNTALHYVAHNLTENVKFTRRMYRVLREAGCKDDKVNDEGLTARVLAFRNDVL